MKLDIESNVVSSAGLQETTGFQIAASAHAFRILSSGLYSDKIGAVLREIGCNAADAHIAAGTPDLPFEVHLPSKLYSKFYVRDFGPGLSHDEILSLYTTYFSSSKSQSNDFTGAFGLGSKSPFSYTDNFTVVSAHNGIKTTYTAYVGQNGAPQISKISEAPVDDDWPHGLMVSMPVKPQDYTEFHTKAQNIFAWFRVTPKMVNSPPIKPHEFVLDGGTYAVLKDASAGLSVLMGNVRYPVPSSEYDQQKFFFARSMPLVLRLSIGDVDVAASREHLEFTDKTRASIKTALNAVGKEIGIELVKQVRAFDTSTLDGMRKLHAWIYPQITKWGYVNLKSLLGLGGMKDDEFDKYDPFMYNNPQVPVPKDFDCTMNAYRLNRRGQLSSIKYEYVKGRGGQYMPGTIKDNTAFVLVGDAKYKIDRIRHAVSNDYNILIVVPDMDDADVVQIAKELGSYPTVKLEDLPLPQGWLPPKKRPKKAKPNPIQDVTATMARIKNGSFTIEKDFKLEDAAANEKFFAYPVNNWGHVKWAFGNNLVYDEYAPIRAIAALTPHIPELPRGIALLKRSEIRRYKLVEAGWQDVASIRPILESADVRSKVRTIKTRSLSGVQIDGTCYETASPMLMLASHARNKTKFWQAISDLIPNSPLITLARAVGTDTTVQNTKQPIDPDTYNDLVSVFGWSFYVSCTTEEDTSKKDYPITTEALSYAFPNSAIRRDPVKAAKAFAALIELDEQALATPISLAA